MSFYEVYMDTENVSLAGESLVVLTELAYGTDADAAKIAGVAVDGSSDPVVKSFTMIGDPSFGSPYSNESSTDKISKVLANAVTVEFGKQTKVYNGNTRTLKAGGAAADPETISVVLFETDPATYNWLRDARNAQTPFILTLPWALDSGFTISGWVRMVCTITALGDFKPPANDVAPLDVTFTGKAIAQVAAPTGFPLALGAFDVMGYDTPGLAVPDLTLVSFQTLVDGLFKVTAV